MHHRVRGRQSTHSSRWEGHTRPNALSIMSTLCLTVLLTIQRRERQEEIIKHVLNFETTVYNLGCVIRVNYNGRLPALQTCYLTFNLAHSLHYNRQQAFLIHVAFTPRFLQVAPLMLLKGHVLKVLYTKII